MAFTPTRDFLFEVAQGNVPGMAILHKFGENPDIDSAGGYEDIWGGGGHYTGQDATAAETLELFSSDANDTSAGTGARTVEIFGLDAAYADQSETISLNGVTAVTSVNTYIRMNRMVVRTGGTGGGNAGILTCRQTTTTANVMAVMQVGYNQTMIAAYTTQAGCNCFFKEWFASIGNKTNGVATVRLLVRPFGEVWQVKEQIAIAADGTSYVNRIYSIPKNSVGAKADIKIEADSSVNNLAISAGFTVVGILS